ncbi:unnamed protein product, partial [Mesorhabditis spiculigera]
MSSIIRLNVCAVVGSMACISLCVLLFAAVFEECQQLEQLLNHEMLLLQKDEVHVVSMMAEIQKDIGVQQLRKPRQKEDDAQNPEKLGETTNEEYQDEAGF